MDNQNQTANIINPVVMIVWIFFKNERSLCIMHRNYPYDDLRIAPTSFPRPIRKTYDLRNARRSFVVTNRCKTLQPPQRPPLKLLAKFFCSVFRMIIAIGGSKPFDPLEPLKDWI